MPRITGSAIAKVVAFFNTAPLMEVETALELARDAVRRRTSDSEVRRQAIIAGRRRASKGGPPAPKKRRGKKATRLAAAHEQTEGALPPQRHTA